MLSLYLSYRRLQKLIGFVHRIRRIYWYLSFKFVLLASMECKYVASVTLLTFNRRFFCSSTFRNLCCLFLCADVSVVSISHCWYIFEWPKRWIEVGKKMMSSTAFFWFFPHRFLSAQVNLSRFAKLYTYALSQF